MTQPSIDNMRAAWNKWNQFKENPAGSNCTPFGAWYGIHCAAWCAMSLSYMWGVECQGNFNFVGLGPHGSASVGVWMQAFQRAGRWTHNPQPGDFVMYGNGEHIEWVDQVTSSGIVTWGGNTGPSSASNGGEIAHQFRPFSSWITGFGRPDYGAGVVTVTEGDEEEMYVLGCQNPQGNNRTAQYLLTGSSIFQITDPNDLTLLGNQGIKHIVVNPGLFDKIAAKAV